MEVQLKTLLQSITDDQVQLFVDEKMKPTFFDKLELKKNTESVITVPFKN
jgi:hypothetical protein